MPREKEHVPIQCKQNLTIAEASEYSNIGENKLRELVDSSLKDSVIKIGNRTLINRKKFDEWSITATGNII